MMDSVSETEVLVKIQKLDTQVAHMAKDLAVIRMALMGNGTPTAGLVYRFVHIERAVEIGRKVLWLIITPLVVGFVGLVAAIVSDSIKLGII